MKEVNEDNKRCAAQKKRHTRERGITNLLSKVKNILLYLLNESSTSNLTYIILETTKEDRKIRKQE